MEKLEDSNHFVTLNQVPSFDVSTRVLDVYEQLVQLGRGGFILDTDEDRYFIKAGELAEETIFGISAKAKSLFGVETTIGELCFDSRTTATFRVEMDPDTNGPVTDDSDLSKLKADKNEKAYSAVSSSGLVGLFLNHETMSEPATKQILYRCENGHLNPDPDHGTCYQCPGDIIEQVQQ